MPSILSYAKVVSTTSVPTGIEHPPTYEESQSKKFYESSFKELQKLAAIVGHVKVIDDVLKSLSNKHEESLKKQ